MQFRKTFKQQDAYLKDFQSVWVISFSNHILHTLQNRAGSTYLVAYLDVNPGSLQLLSPMWSLLMAPERLAVALENYQAWLVSHNLMISCADQKIGFDCCIWEHFSPNLLKPKREEPMCQKWSERYRSIKRSGLKIPHSEHALLTLQEGTLRF